MRLGACTKCMLDFIPKDYFDNKNKIWYKGCEKCTNRSFWSGGKTK